MDVSPGRSGKLGPGRLGSGLVIKFVTGRLGSGLVIKFVTARLGSGLVIKMPLYTTFSSYIKMSDFWLVFAKSKKTRLLS